MNTKQLDAFTLAYCVAALWTSDPEPGQGDYADRGLSIVDSITPEWIAQAISDCARFQSENAALLERAGTAEQNGHDFWLTRNGHGAGFWDRGYDDDVAVSLTNAAHAFGEAYLDWEYDINREDSAQ